jgi:hypothetical protein
MKAHSICCSRWRSDEHPYERPGPRRDPQLKAERERAVRQHLADDVVLDEELDRSTTEDRMKICSTCLHWQGDVTTYAAGCALRLRAKPVFDQGASDCMGYTPLPETLEASDAAAYAHLLRLCITCTAAEIQAVLDALPALDSRWCDSTFAGIVAVQRGYRWARGVPGATGVYHGWEAEHIRPDGAPERRALLGAWLREALIAAQRREGIAP